jgi:ketosteroid isomerase-like protein
MAFCNLKAIQEGSRGMADREAIRKLIEQAYAARDSGDVNGVMAAFHANGAFELAGAKTTLALAGAVEGHPGVRETMARFVATFEFIKRDVVSMIIDGDRAAVHSRLKIRFIPKDSTFTSDVVDVFRIQDGKILELVEFADTALIKEITAT